MCSDSFRLIDMPHDFRPNPVKCFSNCTECQSSEGKCQTEAVPRNIGPNRHHYSWGGLLTIVSHGCPLSVVNVTFCPHLSPLTGVEGTREGESFVSAGGGRDLHLSVTPFVFVPINGQKLGLMVLVMQAATPILELRSVSQSRKKCVRRKCSSGGPHCGQIYTVVTKQLRLCS